MLLCSVVKKLDQVEQNGEVYIGRDEIERKRD